LSEDNVSDIEHKLTKPISREQRPGRTDERTIKDASIKRFNEDQHVSPRKHLGDFA
jgi:hypothetical protein